MSHQKIGIHEFGNFKNPASVSSPQLFSIFQVYERSKNKSVLRIKDFENESVRIADSEIADTVLNRRAINAGSRLKNWRWSAYKKDRCYREKN